MEYRYFIAIVVTLSSMSFRLANAQATFTKDCVKDADCTEFNGICVGGVFVPDGNNNTQPAPANPTAPSAGNGNNPTTAAGNTTGNNSAPIVVLPPSPLIVGGKCGCRNASNWVKEDTRCVHRGRVQEICFLESTVCVDPNSLCTFWNDNTGTTRCVCRPQYIDVDTNGTVSCARQLSTREDRDGCMPCSNNEGVCYDVNGDLKTDGCQCPKSRSGALCEITHVNVTCNQATFTMRICYEAHVGVNFSDNALLYVRGKIKEYACVARESDGSFCPVGTYQLDLPLRDDIRNQCNIHVVNDGPDIKRYEAEMIVQKGGSATVADDIFFKTYCSFNTQMQATFQGVAILNTALNNRGEHVDPTLVLFVENSVGQVVPQSAWLRLGDYIRLRMELRNDGTYTGIRVERCTASDRASIPDRSATTVMLLNDGCPVSAQIQRVFTRENNWRLVDGQSNLVQTGLVPVFKLSQRDIIFMHCTVKLCLNGREAECAPLDCSQTAVTQRKRRAAEATPENIESSVSQQLLVFDPSTDVAGVSYLVFGVVVAILIAILLVFMILTILLFLKFKSKKKKVPTATLR